MGAYEPSIWNIAWTKGTDINAVMVTGYYKQAVTGLPNTTPLLISSQDNNGPCGHTFARSKNLTQAKMLSKKVYGIEPSQVHYASDGKLLFAEQLISEDELFTAADIPPGTFFGNSKPFAGKAGLIDYLNRGFLRYATEKNLERWLELHVETLSKDKEFKNVMSHSEHLRTGIQQGVYVIKGDITISAGLYGGNSVIFFLEAGVKFPEGIMGHSSVYNLKGGTCLGTGGPKY